MRKFFTIEFLLLGVLLAWMPGALANSVTGGQSLSANLGANAKLAVVQPTVTLIHAGTTFANFTGTVTVQYKVRTTPSGSSTLVVKAASDFSPATGPSVAGGDLTYTCSGATLGSNCSGTPTISTTATTNVVTVGAGVCTGAGCGGSDPNSVSVSLILADSPTFKTGTYTNSLLFSISAI
jgi:hypothetical protein